MGIPPAGPRTSYRAPTGELLPLFFYFFECNAIFSFAYTIYMFIDSCLTGMVSLHLISTPIINWFMS